MVRISCSFFSNGASRSVGFVDLTESSSSASTSVPYQERAQPYIDVESYSSRRSDSSRVVGDVSQKGPLCELGVNYGTRLITIFVPPSTTVAQVRFLSLNTNAECMYVLLDFYKSYHCHAECSIFSIKLLCM